MTDPDPFDEIVERLDLDLTFPESAAPPSAPAPASPPAPPQWHDPEADPFYREVTSPGPLLRRPSVLMAWLGILGGPVLIMAASITHWILPRPLLWGLGLVFVAAAIYLIAQLPERGPGEPHWPDDGAQL